MMSEELFTFSGYGNSEDKKTTRVQTRSDVFLQVWLIQNQLTLDLNLQTGKGTHVYVKEASQRHLLGPQRRVEAVKPVKMSWNRLGA